MAVRALSLVLLVCSLIVAGCGTVINLARSRPEEGGRIPFGGVRHDVASLQSSANRDASPGTNTPSTSHAHVAVMLLCAADLPFSAVGDLVTWPYTAAFTFINQPV